MTVVPFIKPLSDSPDYYTALSDQQIANMAMAEIEYEDVVNITRLLSMDEIEEISCQAESFLIAVKMQQLGITV